jgi:hypothetical protein
MTGARKGVFSSLLLALLMIIPALATADGPSDISAADQKVGTLVDNDGPMNERAPTMGPTIFTENLGQFADEIRFSTSSGSGHIAFFPNKVLYDLRDQDEGCVVGLNFVGANDVVPEGTGLLEGRCNYFYGSDPDGWVTGARSFEGVLYEDLWDGIDLAYCSDPSGLKYEFRVHPGADPEDISIGIEGHASADIVSGDLIIRAGDDLSILDGGLVSFERESGSEVSSEFVLNGDNYGFRIGPYDRDRTLIIDPLLHMSYVGGWDDDYGYGVALDGSDNQYFTGYTYSSNYPTKTGSYDTKYASSSDVFVTKMNPKGTSLIYSTFIGGNSYDEGRDLDLDSSGNAYITGYTYSYNSGGNGSGNSSSGDFPTTSGAYDTTHNGNYDVFVLKLSSDGTKLLYSTFVGTAWDEYGEGVKVDDKGRAYVTGYTYSTSFPTTSGCYDDSSNGNNDIILFRVNETGGDLEYSTFIGGSSNEYGNGIDIDGSGYVYITGYTYSYDYPTTSSAFMTSSGGSEDVIVSKFASDLSDLDYSTYVGGSYDELGWDLKVDPEGNAFVTGYSYYYGWGNNSDYPVTDGAYDTTPNGRADVIVFKLNYSGGSLDYSTYIGNQSSEYGFGIAIDPDGIAYITGYTYENWPSTLNYPTTWGALQRTHKGYMDVILSKLSADGSTLLYSSLFGGYDSDRGHDIALDSSRNSVITGITYSPDFPAGDSSYDTSHNWGYDVLIMKSDFKLVFPPSEPLYLTADLKREYAMLNWNIPLSKGTAGKIDGYIIYRDEEYGGGNGTNRSRDMYQIDYTTNGTSYKDYGINLGLTYYYAVVAVSRYGESNMSNIAIATDLEPPTINSTTPERALTGEQFRMSAIILDNLAVQFTFLDYWYDGGSTHNDTLYEMDGEYAKSIPIALDEKRDLYFAISAIDYYGIWAYFGPIRVPMLPNRPDLRNDLSPSTATTGDTYEFSVRAIDDDVVKEAYVEYGFGAGAAKNTTLVKSSDGSWKRSVDVDPAVTELTYMLHAVDRSGNWNQSSWRTVPVLDNDLPTMGTDKTPARAYTGSRLIFEMAPTDNIGIGSASVEYWFGDGERENATMEPEGTLYQYGLEIPLDMTDPVSYIYHISDTSGNWLTTATLTRQVVDDRRPQIGVDLTSRKAYANHPFTFRTSASDNVGIDEVRVQYWFGDESPFNITMIGEGTDQTLTISIPNMLKELNYYFYALDLSGTSTSTAVRTVEVEDIDVPTIELGSIPTDATSGSEIAVSAMVKDNIRVSAVHLEYWYVEGEIKNVSVPGSGSYTTTIRVLRSFSGEMMFSFKAADPSGNWNSSDVRSISVSDAEPPRIVNDMSPSSGYLGDRYSFSVMIEDNVGIGSVTVEYWFDDGEHRTVAMTGLNVYQYAIEIEKGHKALHYIVHVTDMDGNTVDSTQKDVTLKGSQGSSGTSAGGDEDTPIWLYIIIVLAILMFLMTVVNMVMFLSRPKQMNAPGGAPMYPPLPDPNAPPGLQPLAQGSTLPGGTPTYPQQQQLPGLSEPPLQEAPAMPEVPQAGPPQK